MDQSRSTSSALAVFLGVVVACPFASADGSSPDSFQSIQVVPATIELAGPHVRHRLLVTAITAESRELDATRSASFTVEDADVARVESGGVVHGWAEGATAIVVSIGPHRARVEVAVGSASVDRLPSFRNDIMPIISKAGCNAGACHGKQGGQGGFKLSVLGFDPQSDHTAIVKGARGRRVFLAAPHESLVVRKPTARVKHGGGRRIEPASEAYETLVRWLEHGASFSLPDEPSLVGITIAPTQRSYRLEADQQLLVRASYSDGSTRDVTDLTQFGSNDDEIAAVGDTGVVKVQRTPGEAVILARYLDRVALSRVLVPQAQRVPAERYAALPRNNFIDEHVYAKLSQLGLLPSETCTDGEFIRRASLDAIGTLPTPEQTRAFLADSDPDKRNTLIDRLLDQRAYADHWAVRWGDLLRGNPVRIGTKSVFMWDMWLRDAFRKNQPYDQFVRDILTAQGSTHVHGPTNLFRDRRSPEEVTTLVSQIFLGVRMECARCHHHPNEKWSQRDFYQLAAFFGELKRKGRGISPPISEGEEFIYHAPGGRVTHPVSGEAMPPTPPDAGPADIASGRDPRAALVDWMVRPDNPFFAHAVVNRVWAAFMGRGLVEPVDDFRASNPPTNQPLLDALAADFIVHDFDLKHLMRVIMRSAAYQFGSLPNETNVRDTQHHSRAYRRRIPAEVLLDAVADVTQSRPTLEGLAPGTRALAAWNHRLDSYFMDAFGRPDGSADCPCERGEESSVVQALHLMNSETLQKQIIDPKGRAATLAAGDATVDQIIEELYLAAYSRRPTDEESAIARAVFAEPDATRQTATEDVLWALLNSAEFVFNH